VSNKSKAVRKGIGDPKKNFHIKLWITKEHNNTDESCDVCNGNVLYRFEGYNEKTGEGYYLYACNCLECAVETEMRIFALIK
jgi:hypothetical protein